MLHYNLLLLHHIFWFPMLHLLLLLPLYISLPALFPLQVCPSLPLHLPLLCLSPPACLWDTAPQISNQVLHCNLPSHFHNLLNLMPYLLLLLQLYSFLPVFYRPVLLLLRHLSPPVYLLDTVHLFSIPVLLYIPTLHQGIFYLQVLYLLLLSLLYIFHSVLYPLCLSRQYLQVLFLSLPVYLSDISHSVSIPMLHCSLLLRSYNLFLSMLHLLLISLHYIYHSVPSHPTPLPVLHLFQQVYPLDIFHSVLIPMLHYNLLLLHHIFLLPMLHHLLILLLYISLPVLFPLPACPFLPLHLPLIFQSLQVYLLDTVQPVLILVLHYIRISHFHNLLTLMPCLLLL